MVSVEPDYQQVICVSIEPNYVLGAMINVQQSMV